MIQHASDLITHRTDDPEGMKGISMLLSIVLLVLAHALAIYLKKCGALPAAGQANQPSLLQASHAPYQAPSPVQI